MFYSQRVELENELNRLISQYKENEYQRLRAQEYPPMTDYLDAVVKGDLAQQQAYIDACLAVKAKYPKPEGL
jgi:tRNA A37 N6-isopentenylltransferase MiaA